MKIEETKNGNIKIVISKKEALALYKLLDRVDIGEFLREEKEREDVTELWDLLYTNQHLYD